MALQTLGEAFSGDLRAQPLSFVEIVGNAITRAVTTLLDWQQRASQRRELSGLDPSFLKDMGIDRATAYREVAKPFWRELGRWAVSR